MADITLAAAMYACQVLIFLVCTTAVTSSDVHYQVRLSSAPAGRTFVPDFSHVNVVAYDPFRYRRQAVPSSVTPPSISDVTENNGTSTGQASPQGTNATASPTTTVNSTTPVPPVDGVNTTNPFEGAQVTHDNHLYYTSDLINNDFDTFWTELATATQHKTLSSAHRVAGILQLKFKFYFYGHEVTNITVATGGFIYMSPFLHQWLTATQYIAPLMANFDPSLSNASNIYYESLDDKFIVEWKDVILKDQQDIGKFHFQTILHRDNSITFVYKTVPIAISNISRAFHPVKVGVSDAYYNDTYIPQYKIKRRTIYEYHKLSVDTSLVRSGSVVILNPLPTCNLLTTCDSCTTHTNVDFECRWCNKIGRCSDGLDWYRQHWDNLGCKTNHTVLTSECSTLPPPSHPIVDPIIGPVIDKCDNGECDDDKDSDFPVAVVVVVILLVSALLAGVGGWVFYAYTHPTSKSGMWLMEHRPSQIKAKIKFWKSSTASGAKYQMETDA